MLFNWFDKAPLLEEASTQWLLQSFSWCRDHFDADFFYQQTPLVIPSNQFFPGRADSVHGMAELIFERVKTYAGMAHWPFELLEPGQCALDAPLQIQIEDPLRGTDLPPAAADLPRLPVQYDPRQINNPEAMIATYAHALAYYLSGTATQPPPGDPEHHPHATEVLAIFMGFGLMFANSAFTFRGGCGSCQTVGRAAYLSEFEATYALAIFCVLKEIPPRQVTPYLKKHLRGFFKRAMREVSVENIKKG
ncbi:hypothetical protein QUF61_04825 [Candidatus Venteria ishoeyi]|uniref:hypothetical protein n=1 Tax=Candidatus Venteria ishoeyi TaxID=1899563 RepID=UPI0025A4EAD9|nr:hypothetical protein [Candidatus Venteria ishoeyi]MDM8545793.1 hypothetical protein [Candidatus Venteria ishoeyi]